MALKDDSELPTHYGEVTLICMDCDRKLVAIVKIEQSGKPHSYSSQCPCGSMSFRQRVDGKVKIAPAPDLPILDIQTEADRTLFITRRDKQ